MSAYRRILVITPTLGESPFLDMTIKSVSTQLLEILHVLSVPADKVEALRARYPHLQVVPDAGKVGGIYGAINAALASASGDWDWFTYINDDDLLLPGFSEAVYRHLVSGDDASVIYGDVAMIDEEGRPISMITVERNPLWIPALLKQGISPLMQQGMLFRRETVTALRGFDLRYRLCADLDFWLRALVSGATFRYYPLNVAQFRLRSGQLSGNTELTMREQDEIVKRHLPVSLSSLHKLAARWQYRAYNFPRYLTRLRKHGFRTSYQMLENKPKS